MARRPESCSRPICATAASSSRRSSSSRALLGARRRSRCGSSRAPTGITSSSRPASTGGARRCSSPRPSATGTSRRSRSGCSRSGRSSGSRSLRTTSARSRTRSPSTAFSAAMTGTSRSRSCADSATSCRTRSPPAGCASGRTARSVIWLRAWRTSCAGCSRTRATTRSSTPKRRAWRWTSSCHRHNLAHVFPLTWRFTALRVDLRQNPEQASLMDIQDRSGPRGPIGGGDRTWEVGPSPTGGFKEDGMSDQVTDLGARMSSPELDLFRDGGGTAALRAPYLTGPTIVEHGGLTGAEALPAPVRRDATFRRMLAVADIASATAALCVVRLLTGHSLVPLELLALPLIVVGAKLMGRYDRDDMMLRRSTLDEVPQLFALAAVWAITWSLIAFPARDAILLAGAGIALLWLATGGLLVVGRTFARQLAKLLTPPERVLIVGTAHARERLAHSLGTDPAARIEIVGFLPLEDERSAEPGGDRRASGDRRGASRRKRRRTFDDLARVVAEEKVDRVFLIPTSADSELMLEAVNRTTALGVNVS